MKTSTCTKVLTRRQRIFLAQFASAVLLSLSTFNYAFPQGVGINTASPDPSAALDIQATNKGILIPRVSLQSGVDGTTVPNPATGLIIYNTNVQLTGGDGSFNGAGLYQNTGTPATPNWESVSKFKLPYNRSTSSNEVAFRINNFSNNISSGAIHAFSQGGFALIADGKIKITGNGQQPGVGKVLMSDNFGHASWQGGVAFKAVGVKSGGGNVVAPNTFYKIPFNSKKYDRTDSYNLNNDENPNTFIAPIAGIYHFDSQIIATNLDDLFLTLSLIVEANGNSSVAANVSGRIGNLSLSTDVELQAGDKVFVGFAHESESNFTISGSDDGSYFSGHFIQR